MKRCSTLAFLGILASALAAHAADPDAKTLLAEAMTYVSGLDAVSTAVNMSLTIRHGNEVDAFDFDSTITLRGDRECRVRISSDTQKVNFVSDGAKQIVHMEHNRQYIEDIPMPRRELIGTIFGGPLGIGSSWMAGFLHNGADILTAPETFEYLGRKSLAVEGNPDVMCHHLRLSSIDDDLELWIDAEDAPLLYKFRLDLTKSLEHDDSHGADLTSIIEFIFSNWEPNANLPEDYFVFTPPEGVQRLSANGMPQDRMIGKPAPAISLELLDGGTLDLADHKGKNVVILDFWATWCGPCRTAMPIIEEVVNEFAGRDIALYAVNLREPPDLIRSFLERHNLSVQVALDPKYMAANLYLGAGGGIPRTVMIDKEGIVRIAYAGIPRDTSLYKGQLRSELNALLGEEPKTNADSAAQ